MFVDDLGNINGGLGALTDSLSIPLTIDSVNDPPLLDLLFDPVVVPQDASSAAHSVTGFVVDRYPAGDLPTPSDESGQTVTITGVSVISETADVVVDGTVDIDDSTGELIFTANGGVSGVATIEISLTDDGGPGAEPAAVNTQTFDIQVGINQEPTFTFTGNNADDNIEVPASSGSHTFLAAVSDVDHSATPLYDFPLPQTISSVSIVTVTNDHLFDSDPVLVFNPLTEDYNLEFTVAPGLTGTSEVTFTVIDDGGTDNGGDDTATHTFDIIIGTTPTDPDAPFIESIKFVGRGMGTQPGWSTDFLDFIDPTSTLELQGFSLPHGTPWANGSDAMGGHRHNSGRIQRASTRSGRFHCPAWRK